MKQLIPLAFAALCVGGLMAEPVSAPAGFVSIDGTSFTLDGKKFDFRGVNTGQWLNPEGYIMRFKKCNSPRFIDEMFRQLVGPEATDEFWRGFVENYVTEDDIAALGKRGVNVIRAPFHYKLFTDELYLGGRNRGFEIFDKLVEWCSRHGVRVIFDMHDAPGGQTGDNIDDSYGWPWIYVSENYQRQFCEIWRAIAARYRDNPTVIGYDIMNEPLGWQVKGELRKDYDARHEPLCKRVLAAIREVDTKHIVFFPGTSWNTDFTVFRDLTPDPLVAYQCHSYGTATVDRVNHVFSAFRDKSGRPMWMGETGQFVPGVGEASFEAMRKADIGWTVWCYKMPPFATVPDKPTARSGFAVINLPEGWDDVVNFAEGARTGYGEMDQTLFDTVKTRERAQGILKAYLEAIKFKNCRIDEEYIADVVK